MIKPINEIPAVTPPKGRRQLEILDFLSTGEKIGQYIGVGDEDVMNIYHSFRHAIRKLQKSSEVDVMVRRGEIFFVRLK